MDEKELLNKMVELASSEEKRVDTYIDHIQTFLKGSSNWTQQHETIFKEMLKEIHNSRRLKTVFSISLVIFIGLSIILGGMSFYLNNVKNQKVELIELIRNSQLAVRLKQDANKNGMAVVIDSRDMNLRPQTANKEKKVQEILKEIPVLGKHYGLGPDKNLKLMNIDDENNCKFRVLPDNADMEQTLGTFKITENHDKIVYTSIPLKIRGDVRYPELNNFYIQIITYIEKPVAPPADQEVLWKVKFLERNDDNGVYYSNEFEVEQTPAGRIEKDPFWVHNPHWKSFYIVTVGIGRMGKDKDTNQEFAWNLQSVARRFTLE